MQILGLMVRSDGCLRTSVESIHSKLVYLNPWNRQTIERYQPVRKLTHDEVAQRRQSLKRLDTAERLPVEVLLDNVRSLYNVGSIFRTSDGAMIEKLYLCGFTPHPPRKEIEKTALGATQSVPWEYQRNARDQLMNLKRRGIRVCVLELTTSSIPYYEIKRDHFPLCLVIGNELTGVSKDIVEMVDLAIEIPMFGIKHSLNVAVAYGIALFELSRIYRQSNRAP
jgi:tRNA G18 (ribose-2'-O)-methylase SpoU